MQANIVAALSALDDDFSKIQGFDVVPDGEYWCVVDDVSLGMTQASGNPRIIWKLRVLRSDYYDRQLQRVLVVTRDTLRWLKRDLYMAGVAICSLTDLPDRLDNLANLKVRVRKQGKAVHILDVDAPVSAQGSLFLHFIDEDGCEYLDQQLLPRQQPNDQDEIDAIVSHFVTRYQCPRPHEAYVEDAATGAILFSTEPLKE